MRKKAIEDRPETIPSTHGTSLRVISLELKLPAKRQSRCLIRSILQQKFYGQSLPHIETNSKTIRTRSLQRLHRSDGGGDFLLFARVLLARPGSAVVDPFEEAAITRELEIEHMHKGIATSGGQ